MEAFTDLDRRLFEAGRHADLHRVLGAYPGGDGTWFRVWAPNARAVQVIGEFDGWRGTELTSGAAGLWSGFVPGARAGHLYKYRLVGHEGETFDKADPFAVATEAPPGTASVIADLDYAWRDEAWMADRGGRQGLATPISIYEVHLGSWRGPAGDVSYRRLAGPLADHVASLGFTHVELLPVMEHPFYGSWGYQTTGYFAPTSRYGSPQDLMFLIDTLHQRGIGVILDWVPAHFADDPHSLARFDGTPLFEHADARRARHPKWGTLVFNYERPEVRSFLISSACSWLERYHVDGLRVDAVSSMLYRDFSRAAGEWTPNDDGGREDFAAAQLLRDLNDAAHARFPDVRTCAEEATAWPLATHPSAEGGLGFDFKWDVGWMNDTLGYLERDPAERPAHHRELTFRESYAASEHFLLALSHDEASGGRGALRARMPGDPEHALANLRALLGFQFATPGKKLLFMGTELASMDEWDHDRGLDWSAAEDRAAAGTARWIAALNQLYRRQPALHEGDCVQGGLEWVIPEDAVHSVFAFERRIAEAGVDSEMVLVVANFAAVPHQGYRIGVPVAGPWDVLLDGDAREFGGTGDAAVATVEADALPFHGRPCSIVLRLAPLTVTFLAPRRTA